MPGSRTEFPLTASVCDTNIIIIGCYKRSEWFNKIENLLSTKFIVKEIYRTPPPPPPDMWGHVSKINCVINSSVWWWGKLSFLVSYRTSPFSLCCQMFNETYQLDKIVIFNINCIHLVQGRCIWRPIGGGLWLYFVTLVIISRFAFFLYLHLYYKLNQV